MCNSHVCLNANSHIETISSKLAEKASTNGTAEMAPILKKFAAAKCMCTTRHVYAVHVRAGAHDVTLQVAQVETFVRCPNSSCSQVQTLHP